MEEEVLDHMSQLPLSIINSRFIPLRLLLHNLMSNMAVRSLTPQRW